MYHNNIFKKFRNITICKSVAVSQGGSLRRLQSRNIPLATDFLIQQRASYPARIMSRPPFQQENQSNNNAEDEESKLLASLGSAVQNMDSYEQDVLKTAELESAPKLEGIGFPTSLKGNLSQVPAMQQILQNVRTQLQQSPHNLALLLKQQIILNMLHTATNDADLCVRPQEEFRQEQERRHRFQRQMNSSNAATQQQQHPSLHATIARKPKVQKKDPPKSVLKTKPSAGLKRSHDDGDGDASPRTAGERLEEIKHGKGVRFAQDVINQKRRRRRIGIQPRKIKSGGNEIDEEEGKDIQKRKKYLKKLRKQRELRRRKIKQKSSNTDDDNDSDGEEHEFIDEDNVASVKTEEHPSDNTGDTTSMQSFTTSQPSPDTNPRQNDEEPTKDMSVTVLCPLCWEDVHVETPVESDRILSEHMNICQSAKTRGQRRSTRTKTTVRYTENDDDNAMFHDTISAPQNQSAAIFIKKVDPCDIGSQLQMATMPINTHDDDDEAFEAKKLIDDDDEMLEVDAAMDENDEEVIAPNNKKRPASFTPSPRPVALDDWDEDDYEDRVDDWIETGVQSMRVMKEQDKTETPPGEHIYDGGLIIPAWVNDRLFPYQRTALQWMWELHRQQAGGIIGDEMGLGKTVQICAFLGSMASSRKLKSILIISPATMLQHWLQEMAKWAPGVRRILIHQSADTDRRSRSISAPMLSAVNQWLKECRHSRLFEAIDEDDLETRPPHSFPGTAFAFVTTYENVRRNPDIWIHHNWSYVVMDEAQKIRNPDADITLVCKVSPGLIY